jgi:hypothetical protein
MFFLMAAVAIRWQIAPSGTEPGWSSFRFKQGLFFVLQMGTKPVVTVPIPVGR